MASSTSIKPWNGDVTTFGTKRGERPVSPTKGNVMIEQRKVSLIAKAFVIECFIGIVALILVWAFVLFGQ